MSGDAVGCAVGAIHRLAFTTDEADAMALISLAVQRGCSPDEAHEAMRIWQQIRREDTTTLEGAL